METSYNGWTALDPPSRLGLTSVDLPGHLNAFPPGVLQGDVHTVLSYVANRLAREVEPFGPGCWGAAYRPDRNAPELLSCHASGTALDWRAPLHPNGRIGTFTAKQVATIRKILAACGGVVRWGGDFHHPDPMHFEIIGGPAQVAAVAKRLSRPAPVRAVVRVIHKILPPRYRWTHLPLKHGDHNPDVAHLQSAVLCLHGHDVDGRFGDETEKFLKAWQKAHRLVPDGRFGVKSAAKAPR